jgi:hypothetical protein
VEKDAERAGRNASGAVNLGLGMKSGPLELAAPLADAMMAATRRSPGSHRLVRRKGMLLWEGAEPGSWARKTPRWLSNESESSIFVVNLP